MPDGATPQLIPHTFVGGMQLNCLLLDQAGATDNGAWVPMSQFRNATVEVFGGSYTNPVSFVGTVEIFGTNNPAPVNGSGGTQIGGSLTSFPAAVQIQSPWSYICARVTAYTSGTVSAQIHAVTP